MTKDGIRRNERGASLVLFAIALVPIIGTIGLAIDSFRLYTVKMQQESNAEMAALAAMEWYHTTGSNTAYHTRVDQSIRKAEEVAGLNRYSNDESGLPVVTQGSLANHSAGNVRFGLWSFNAGCRDNPPTCFIPTDAAAATNAVKVTLTKTNLKTFLGGVVGLKSFKSRTSSAIVHYDVSKLTANQTPFIVVHSW